MSTGSTLFQDWLEACVNNVGMALEKALPGATEVPAQLHEAMRYATLGGGKRVRATLVYAAGKAALQQGVAIESYSHALDRAAAAVELIHSYSLIHDDLPCMDDDVLRRGQPTVHVRFGEATAMLAGDALQPLAFAELAKMPVAPALVVQAVQVLGQVAGSLGMVGGQAIDLASVNQALTLEQLQFMHRLKTGALIEGSVLLGAIVTGATSETRQALETYGSAIGLAFQIVDDILDVTVDTEGLGKTAGKDAHENKPTYVSIMGLEESRDFARKLHEVALEAIKPLGDSAIRLKELADFIIHRSY
ncbi:polyprenyl synthetase family protein [Advenella sp. WQ 585]|uniref:Polyprenyl synthetase family protein n=1 Tax=Advenella mandrilli TaxID=2800330 RepID=A0ABS1EAQ3_9BURK|nr:farnesyl diphosphate synthase [Advenella mandrilli]MBK1779858.1 polyprenyl synthetase family protein [Advenella mandrilli]